MGDPELLTREQLLIEVRKLRAASVSTTIAPVIRCAGTIPSLGTLTEPIPADILVPEWPRFLRGCVKYWEALDHELSDANRTDAEFSGS